MPHKTPKSAMALPAFKTEVEERKFWKTHDDLGCTHAPGRSVRRILPHNALYSSWRRNSPQPWSRMALFKPAFCLTLRPGASTVPAADALMFLTRKSSIQMIACSRTIAVLALCKKSRRQWPMSRCTRDTLAFALCQFFENFTLRLMRRWYLANRCSCFLKLFSGARKAPSFIVAKRVMPTSMPMAVVDW